MSQTVSAIFEDGALKPLEKLNFHEHEEVRGTVASRSEEESTASLVDPLHGLSVATGIPDLAEHFDDYRLGRRQP